MTTLHRHLQVFLHRRKLPGAIAQTEEFTPPVSRTQRPAARPGRQTHDFALISTLATLNTHPAALPGLPG